MSAAEPQKRSVLSKLSASASEGATLVLRRLNIWLRKAALNATSAILGCSSSITLTQHRRLLTLQNSSPTDSAGEQRNSELRFGNVVCFAPTAIADILWNSRDTIPTMMSSPLCREFMTDTISPNRVVEVRDGLESGTLEFATISLEEYLQVSFLMLYHGEEVHVEQKVVYGGGVYNLHACLALVHPPSAIAELRKKV